MNITQRLLNKHDALDAILNDKDKGVFFSDWNCINPFVKDYLDEFFSLNERETSLYKYFEDDIELSNTISKFHLKAEDVIYGQRHIVAGNGSTSFISTFCLWLSESKIDEVYYLPPLYYCFHYMGLLLNINFIAISERHAYEPSFTFSLPRKKSILIITDPTWYAGICLQHDLIDQIVRWQRETNSIVFVDGSFQYCNWSEVHFEHSSKLNKELTFRLICPTKAFLIHGVRFSYLLVPQDAYERIRYIYTNTHGSTSFDNIRYAKLIMKKLTSHESNSRVIAHIREIYNKLIKSGIIENEFVPNSGYFVFAKLTENVNGEFKQLGMDGSYFEQPRLNNYIRINLLAPDTLRFLLDYHI